MPLTVRGAGPALSQPGSTGITPKGWKSSHGIRPSGSSALGSTGAARPNDPPPATGWPTRVVAIPCVVGRGVRRAYRPASGCPMSSGGNENRRRGRFAPLPTRRRPQTPSRAGGVIHLGDDALPQSPSSWVPPVRRTQGVKGTRRWDGDAVERYGTEAMVVDTTTDLDWSHDAFPPTMICGPGQQPRLGRSQHGHRWASRHARTGLDRSRCSVQPKPAAHWVAWPAVSSGRCSGTGADKPAPPARAEGASELDGILNGSSVCQARSDLV